jgi:2'-hydroxyisoflavone reductase
MRARYCLSLDALSREIVSFNLAVMIFFNSQFAVRCISRKINPRSNRHWCGKFKRSKPKRHQTNMTIKNNNQRRQFLKASAVALGTAATVQGVSRAAMAESGASTKSLNVLFLGGTGFIGPHMVRACLDQGHQVTLFNRGKRNNDLFPDLETIIGDRDPDVGEGLSGLENRKWDVVVDTSGYLPRHVNASAELLANSASQYLFISTVSVYADFSIVGMDETAPLATLDDPSTEKITGETYGGLKVLCEQAVEKHFKDRTTIIRPTYIVGPGDHTDRFIHYIHRPMLGGRMAVPGKRDNPVEYIDVRDLASFVEHSLSGNVTGIYNAVSKPSAANFGKLMDLSLQLSKPEVELVWIDGEFLAQQKEKMGDDFASFPMWHNMDDPESAGIGTVSQARAVEAGLTNRAFEETVKDTYQWWIDQPEERRANRRVLISPEFESALLAAWDARQTG